MWDKFTADFLILQLVAGDLNGYRQSCAQFLDQFGNTQDAERANEIVWLCCLAPQALPDFEPPVRLMREAALALPAQNNVLNTYGAVLLRAGRFQEAIQTLHQATRFHSDGGTLFDFVFLAMAYQAVGQNSEARSFLDRAIRSAEAGAVETRWKWRTEFELLRKEAAQQILPAFE